MIKTAGLLVALSTGFIAPSCSDSASENITDTFTILLTGKDVAERVKNGEFKNKESGISSGAQVIDNFSRTYQALKPIGDTLGQPIDQYLATQTAESADLKDRISTIDDSIEKAEDFNSSLNKRLSQYQSDRNNILQTKDKNMAKSFNNALKQEAANAGNALAQIKKDLKALNKDKSFYSTQIANLEKEKSTLENTIRQLNQQKVPTNI